jgi:hypothetical protein
VVAAVKQAVSPVPSAPEASPQAHVAPSTAAGSPGTRGTARGETWAGDHRERGDQRETGARAAQRAEHVWVAGVEDPTPSRPCQLAERYRPKKKP